MSSASSTDRTAVSNPAADIEDMKAKVDAVLEDHRHDRGELIAILLDTQDILGYLPVPAMKYIAERLNIPPIDIFGTATFYRSFKLNPPGRHTCTICMGTACHVRGGPQVLKEFERQLGICAGQTTPDREYELETVACVGACAMGPLVLIDGEYHGNMSSRKVPRLLRRLDRERAEETQ